MPTTKQISGVAVKQPAPQVDKPLGPGGTAGVTRSKTPRKVCGTASGDSGRCSSPSAGVTHPEGGGRDAALAAAIAHALPPDAKPYRPAPLPENLLRQLDTATAAQLQTLLVEVSQRLSRNTA